MRVKVSGALAIVAFVMLAGVCAGELVDRVLAVVSGTVITESDVRAALAFDLVRPAPSGADPIRTTLDQLIRRELILGEVTRSAPTEADAAQVAKRMDAIRASYSSAAAYEAKLAQTAMNETRLRDIVEGDIRIADYMRQRFGAVAEPTDEEVASYYAGHRAEFTSGGRQLALDQASSAVRQRLIEEKRAALIDDWVARLRRRAEVNDLYSPDSGK